MREYKSPERLEKLVKAAAMRQLSLNVVLENIHDKHNVSAIYRTCDAVGINSVSLLYYIEKFPKLGNTVSASSVKWVESEKYTSVDKCFVSLKEKGFKIYASMLREDAVSLYDLDLTQKSAIVFGNEHRGVSDEAAGKADGVFYIPMKGLVQSLNVSVAAAVALYEAMRQRQAMGMYEKCEMNNEELNELINQWCRK